MKLAPALCAFLLAFQSVASAAPQNNPPAPLTKKQLEAKAKEVAAVQITFRSLPTDNSEKPGRDLDLTSRVTFAFSATFAEPTITESGPCK